jgi:hypothetical protein
MSTANAVFFSREVPLVAYLTATSGQVYPGVVLAGEKHPKPGAFLLPASPRGIPIPRRPSVHVTIHKCTVCGRPYGRKDSAVACAERDLRDLMCEVPRKPHDSWRRHQRVSAR